MIPKNSFFEQTSEEIKAISSDKLSQTEQKYQQPISNWRQLLSKIYKIINGPQLKKKKSTKSNIQEIDAQNQKQVEFKCSCKKTKCLKLYCQCLAKGEYCKNCNCEDCFNTPEHDSIRSNIIDEIINKNPDAFEAKSNKKGGCICKKTGCLKKYCQCYSLGQGCGQQCKCQNCQNKIKKN